MTRGTASAPHLEPFLEIPGIMIVAVISRDGFVLDHVGAITSINQEALGASVSLVMNGIQNMGRDLNLLPMQTLTVEYQEATIICCPVGDAICALVCPDSKTLGVIRHKIKGLLPRLASCY